MVPDVLWILALIRTDTYPPVLVLHSQQDADRQRQETYERDLDRMYRKIENRPYLFERIGIGT